MVDPAAPDRRVLAAATPALAGTGRLVTPSTQVRDALRAAGVDAVSSPLDAAGLEGCDGVVLLADELSHAGEHAETLLADVAALTRDGGVVAACAITPLAAEHLPDVRGLRSDELARMLGHYGVAVELLCAPGAAGVASGRPDADYDPVRDRLPGLLDAAPRVLAVGRAARSPAERSERFFATLPRKVVAAAVVCRDGDGRLLVVHDAFKDHWTIPGGVVDADEDPRSAAVREAWEEAGVRVAAGRVLGVFAASWPDRVALVYEASPLAGAPERSAPVHAHEIDDVAWLPLPAALERLAPVIAEQVRHCLEHPGGTLAQRWY